MKPQYSSVAGVVVLFNPGDEVYNTVGTYVNQVDRLFVVDNSTSYNPSLIQKLNRNEKVVYINNGGNKGIANALNVGCTSAIKQNFGFILTMDQDTSLPENFVPALMNGLKEHHLEEVGILAPRYTAVDVKLTAQFQRVLWTMTSGNLLNLSAFEKVGPFLDELFIDHVDHEYCLRLNKFGFNVIQANDVGIVHRPGTIVNINFLGIKKHFSSHSPLRLYYFCRNGFYVANRYRKSFPGFKDSFNRLLLKEICKIPFEKDKMRRIRMIIRGFLDFKSNKFGPASGIK